MEYQKITPDDDPENECLYCGNLCDKSFCDSNCRKAYFDEN